MQNANRAALIHAEAYEQLSDAFHLKKKVFKKAHYEFFPTLRQLPKVLMKCVSHTPVRKTQQNLDGKNIVRIENGGVKTEVN